MTEKDLDIAIEKCEHIMEFDTRTLENPESENGHIFKKVYDLLQFLRQLQFATDTNVGGNLISRQAALDAMETWDKFGCDPDGKLVRYDDDKHYIPYVHYEDMVHAIKHLPSAQRWIPWGSGKFPEESGTYTVTAYDGATKRVTYAKYQKRLKRWELTGARAYWRVLAWMEKPKPWEGGQS